MTEETIRKMGNAIAIFSDPFKRAVNEVFAKSVCRSPRKLRGDARWNKYALMLELDIGGQKVLNDYATALAEGADPEDCFMRCATGLAEVAGVDTVDGFVGHRDFTFGEIQYVINKTEALAYVDYFWNHLGGPIAGIDGKRLNDWFLSPESPRSRFGGCHCLMDDETMGLVVRAYRRCGKNKALAKGRWGKVDWRRLVFPENGEPNSGAWYDKFQGMVKELARPQNLLPLEFLFCCQPEAGFDFAIELFTATNPNVEQDKNVFHEQEEEME